ncbi:MAG: S24/S26 family peptidase [Clostridiales bacterium]|nr:S24/S26 family peptidase [Clostridiales bacterium]
MREVLVTMEDCLPVIARKLAEGGSVQLTAPGTSMLPLLENSVVELTVANGPLKKHDIALYRRMDGEERFVLHRVIRTRTDGSYAMCGDNQVLIESPIWPAQVIAKVSRFEQNGIMVSVDDPRYRRYARRRVASRPFRALIEQLHRMCKSLIRKNAHE